MDTPTRNAKPDPLKTQDLTQNNPMTTYYIMRVKGKAKIPDYIQLRDENLTLIGYFRPGRKERLDKVIKDTENAAKVQDAIEALTEFGKMTKVEI